MLNDSESIIAEVKKRIQAHFDKIVSLDVQGDSGHYTIRLVSPSFEGKSSLNRQRMVFQALGDLIMGPSAPIHAIDRMETLTSESE